MLLMSFLLAAGCASKEEDDTYVERPVGDLYNEAQDKLEAGSYESAAKQFEEVDRQHPYSEWAARAEVNAAYAYYEAGKYDDAVSTLDRFIQLHPGNERVAYAYYLKALCSYQQIRDVQRDQSYTEQALTGLEEVRTRFPDSPYARDAKLKIDLVRDHLAGKDMEIGRYYQQRELYTAAVNRFRSVIENYQTTAQVPEALHRLVECYLALGITDEAQAAGAVLGYNYPGSSWYENSYRLLNARGLAPQKKDGGWLDSIF